MKIALLAGSGQLPRRIIEHFQHTSTPFIVLAFPGQTPEDLSDCAPLLWAPLGAVGDILQILKTHHVTHIVMAGTMRRPSWSELKLDWMGTRWLMKMGLKSLGDDGLLTAAISLLKAEGLEVLSPADVLDDLLAPVGVLGEHSPTDLDLKDIEYGRRILSVTGPLDIGQSVVIQQELVLAVEAIEGTAAMLERCQTLRRSGEGGVLVKMRKPQQSRLVDLPTVGVETIHQLKAAGLKGMAIEAGAAQILHRDLTIQLANEQGLFMIGIQPLMISQ